MESGIICIDKSSHNQLMPRMITGRAIHRAWRIRHQPSNKHTYPFGLIYKTTRRRAAGRAARRCRWGLFLWQTTWRCAHCLATPDLIYCLSSLGRYSFVHSTTNQTSRLNSESHTTARTGLGTPCPRTTCTSRVYHTDSTRTRADSSSRFPRPSSPSTSKVPLSP